MSSLLCSASIHTVLQMKYWQEDVIAVALIAGVALGYFVQASFVPQPQKPIVSPSAAFVAYEPITVVPSAPSGASSPTLGGGGGSCGQ